MLLKVYSVLGTRDAQEISRDPCVPRGKLCTQDGRGQRWPQLGHELNDQLVSNQSISLA